MAEVPLNSPMATPYLPSLVEPEISDTRAGEKTGDVARAPQVQPAITTWISTYRPNQPTVITSFWHAVANVVLVLSVTVLVLVIESRHP